MGGRTTDLAERVAALRQFAKDAVITDIVLRRAKECNDPSGPGTPGRPTAQ